MTAEKQVVYLGEMSKLKLDPGDVLVISCDDILSEFMIEQLQSEMEKTFPGHRSLILHGGLKLGVVDKV